jgi:hypothetical protein
MVAMNGKTRHFLGKHVPLVELTSISHQDVGFEMENLILILEIGI